MAAEDSNGRGQFSYGSYAHAGKTSMLLWTCIQPPPPPPPPTQPDTFPSMLGTVKPRADLSVICCLHLRREEVGVGGGGGGGSEENIHVYMHRYMYM